MDGCAGSKDIIEDPDEGQEEARAALHAAKRSRKNGTLSSAAVLDAMEAAEAKHGAREAQSKAEVHYHNSAHAFRPDKALKLSLSPCQNTQRSGTYFEVLTVIWQ